MNLNYLKFVLMLTTLLLIKSTVLGQPSSIDSVKISRDQQKQCIVWFREGIIKDSIIHTKQLVIDSQRSFIDYTDTLIVDLDLKLKQSNENYVQMKRKRKNAFVIGGVTTIGAFILGFFLKP